MPERDPTRRPVSLRPSPPGPPKPPKPPGSVWLSRLSWPAWRKLLVLAGALLVFGSYDLSILVNERVLARGVIVRLALAPRDPRSLMTGDYMALRYALESRVRIGAADGEPRPPASAAPDGDEAGRPFGSGEADGAAVDRRVTIDGHDGFLIVALDAQRVARPLRAQQTPRPLADGEVALRYRVRGARLRLGTDAWFFQEGSAARYEAARYGEYRVDADGRMLLVRLLDEHFDGL
ncbi:MAG: GDYXXLXY domain-containing protein [Burkholderiaceae bacterium]